MEEHNKKAGLDVEMKESNQSSDSADMTEMTDLSAKHRGSKISRATNERYIFIFIHLI